MSEIANSRKTMTNLLGFAFLASSIIFISLASSLSWFDIVKFSTQSFMSYILLFSFALSLATAIVTLFSGLSSSSGFKIMTPEVWASFFVISLSILHLNQKTTPLGLEAYQLWSLVIQAGLVSGIIAVVTKLLKLEEYWKFWPSAFSGFATLIIGYLVTFVFFPESFSPWTSISFIRELIILISFAIILYLCAFSSKISLNQDSFLDSIKLRVNDKADNFTGANSLAIFFLILILDFTYILFDLISEGNSTTASSIISFMWIPILFISWNRLENFFYNQYRSFLIGSLASQSTRRFMFRHNQSNKRHWAATIGLKSAEFYIDHDPNNILSESLPITVSQIRTEEIKRCIKDLFNNKMLNQDIIGTKIHGSVDPELSHNPCIEILKLYSCLYLDATSLIERRLKGLVSLLPLVDPALSNSLNKNFIDTLVKRNQWFFYIDYSWIDQILTKNNSESKYRVRLNHLDAHFRLQMTQWLEEKGGKGNYIWLSSSTKNQLLKEAPMLAGIIIPVKIKNLLGKSDTVFYLLKFEELVPRLQNFYALDKMREIIQDFLPSSESNKISTLLMRRLENSNTLDELTKFVSAITSYPWYGFREKDKALQLILQVWTSMSVLLEKKSNPSERDKYRNILLKAILKIGYPSQFIHLAQIDKINLRDTRTIISIASNPSHTRFEESWMILSTKDYKYTSDIDKELLAKFFNDVSASPNLLQIFIVVTRFPDALIELALSNFNLYRENTIKILNQLIQIHSNNREPENIFSLLLDRFSYLNLQSDTKIEISEKTKKSLSTYIQKQEEKYKNIPTADKADFIALKSRINFKI